MRKEAVVESEKKEGWKDSKLVQVLLMNEDKSLQLVIGFLGFSQEAVEDYLQKKIIECKQEWPKKYTQMKYI